MSKESGFCKGCFLKKVCSPFLGAEYIVPGSGAIRKNNIPPVSEACRHSSCDEGLDDARASMKEEGKMYVVQGEIGPKIIEGAAFGTYHKPTEEQELRIVDVKIGTIYSWSIELKMYFPTGQNALKPSGA